MLVSARLGLLADQSVASSTTADIALRKDVRTEFEGSIHTITNAFKFTPSLPHPILSARTTNAQSCSSLESRAANTKSHILLLQRFLRLLDHDGNWHCQSQ